VGSNLASVPANSPVSITFEVFNGGPDAASFVAFTNNLVAQGMTITGSSETTSNGGTFTPQGNGNYNMALPVFASVTVTHTGYFSTAGTKNISGNSVNAGDPNTGNNFVAMVVTVTPVSLPTTATVADVNSQTLPLNHIVRVLGTTLPQSSTDALWAASSLAGADAPANIMNAWGSAWHLPSGLSVFNGTGHGDGRINGSPAFNKNTMTWDAALFTPQMPAAFLPSVNVSEARIPASPANDWHIRSVACAVPPGETNKETGTGAGCTGVLTGRYAGQGAGGTDLNAAIHSWSNLTLDQAGNLVKFYYRADVQRYDIATGLWSFVIEPNTFSTEVNTQAVHDSTTNRIYRKSGPFSWREYDATTLAFITDHSLSAGLPSGWSTNHSVKIGREVIMFGGVDASYVARWNLDTKTLSAKTQVSATPAHVGFDWALPGDDEGAVSVLYAPTTGLVYRVDILNNVFTYNPNTNVADKLVTTGSMPLPPNGHWERTVYYNNHLYFFPNGNGDVYVMRLHN
jgi:hypothetical protein